jgi:hypothetical protein
MAYNWTNKGSADKHEYQKILFEYYFEPLKLTKGNLKTIKKQKDKNKTNYEKLFNLYKQDDCLPTTFKLHNNVLIKYLIGLPERLRNDPSKYCNQLMMTNVCQCSLCKSKGSLCLKLEPFLFMAADYGNQEIVEWLVDEKKLDINYLDNHDENILFYSAHLTDLKFIKWLINDRKIDYTHVTKDNHKNLLFKACSFDNLNLVKYLLDELHFDINFTNKMDQTCIFHCCFAETTQVLDYLTERYSLDLLNIKDKYDLTIMYNSRNELFLEHIIKKYKFNMDDYNPKKQNHLIFYAVSFENTNLIDYIVDNSKVNLYNIDRSSNSILYYSLVMLDNYKFTNYLIKKYNLNVNYQNEKGHNILFSAIRKYNYTAAKWIIENTEIDVFQKETHGYSIINDLIHYFDDDDEDIFKDFKDFMIYIFKNTKHKFNSSYMFDICSDKVSPEVNIKILNFMLKTFKPDINYVDKYGENILIKSINFDIDIKFINYIINLDVIELFHKDKKGKDAFYHSYSHEKGSDIIYRIYVKLHNLYFKQTQQLQQVKTMYSNLLRNKNDIETHSPKNILEDSGTDLSFEQFNITNQNKIDMFDDLLAYTTTLKLQVLTMGGEPMPCKNESIDSLI